MDYFDMKFAKFGDNRDPLTPEIARDRYIGRVATEFQLRLLEYVYWKNDIHAEGTDGQFQTVGWHFEAGVRLCNWLYPYYEHHSRHRMDGTVPDYLNTGHPGEFPVEDSYGIRLHFYINPRPSRDLLQ